MDALPASTLFQVERRRWMAGRPDSVSYHASTNSRRIGKLVRAIFEKHQYTFRNCRSILVPLLLDNNVENAWHPERIFSANDFFRHRCQLATNDERTTNMNGLQVLVRLFLFWLAMNREVVERAIGREGLDVLLDAGLVTVSHACCTNIVGEVQAFPISQCDVFGGDNTAKNCDRHGYTNLFATDWPMESLRLTRDAVMAVGDDTLELMVLSADQDGRGRLLDLCCGCGIQGIFAWSCVISSSTCKDKGFQELVCADVNDRACRFVVANFAMNGILDGEDVCQNEGRRVYALKSDLYEELQFGRKILMKGVAGKPPLDNYSDSCPRFDRIISNPPFVAIPLNVIDKCPYTAPALYAVGGGVDGTALLERIVRDSFYFLSDSNSNASILMVTEVQMSNQVVN